MMSPTFKCVIYILIAAFTALSTKLMDVQSFSDITPIKGTVIVLDILLQSLIAMRAFLDQSISNKS